MRLLPITAILALGLAIGAAQAGGPSVGTPAVSKPEPTAAEKTAKRVALDKAVADCVETWDAGTHMTKQDWLRTCRRVQNRLHQFDVR